MNAPTPNGLTEKTDDIFSLLDRGQAAGRKVAIIITTNANIRNDGNAVMGRGIALAAAHRWPQLPWLLAQHLKKNGNVPTEILPGVITFPTKHNWHQDSNLQLIAQSARKLVDITRDHEFVFLPRVGTVNGKLLWETVRDVLAPILVDKKFYIINPPEQTFEKTPLTKQKKTRFADKTNDRDDGR